jgi:hypothetical protein
MRTWIATMEVRMIYLSSPYSHSDKWMMEERFRAVCRAAAHFLRSGINAYSPITYSHPLVLHGLLPQMDQAFWAPFNEQWLLKCTALWVLMLPGWRESIGIRREMEHAESLGLPIKYVVWDTFDVLDEPLDGGDA